MMSFNWDDAHKLASSSEKDFIGDMVYLQLKVPWGVEEYGPVQLRGENEVYITIQDIKNKYHKILRTEIEGIWIATNSVMRWSGT